MRTLSQFLASGLLALASGCASSAPEPVPTLDTFCSKLEACGKLDFDGWPYTKEQCLKDYQAWSPTADCIRAYQGSTCMTVNSPAPDGVIDAACFPDCYGDTCHGSTWSYCGKFGAVAYDCDRYCKMLGKVWFNECSARSSQGQTSKSPQCWCY